MVVASLPSYHLVDYRIVKLSSPSHCCMFNLTTAVSAAAEEMAFARYARGYHDHLITPIFHTSHVGMKEAPLILCILTSDIAQTGDQSS